MWSDRSILDSIYSEAGGSARISQPKRRGATGQDVLDETLMRRPVRKSEIVD